MHPVDQERFDIASEYINRIEHLYGDIPDEEDYFESFGWTRNTECHSRFTFPRNTLDLGDYRDNVRDAINDLHTALERMVDRLEEIREELMEQEEEEE